MLPIKFIRSLDGANQLYPNYEADEAVAKAIADWSRKIQLAGETFDLNVSSNLVFQLTSDTALNRQTYVASVEDTDVVARILEQVRAIESSTLSQPLACKLPKKTPGALLYLQRFVHRLERQPKGGRGKQPGSRKAAQPRDRPEEVTDAGPITLDTHPYCVEDVYWLAILDESGMPAIDVHHDSASCSYVTTAVLNAPDHYVGSLREYFPQPDELVIDWHDLTELVHLDRSVGYVRALCSCAQIQRQVWGRIVAPELILAPLQPIYPGSPDAAVSASDEFKSVPCAELKLRNYYAGDTQAGFELIPPELPFSPSEAGSGTLLVQFDPLPYLRPDFVSTPLTEQLIGVLVERSGGWAVYLGSGRFAVRSSDMQKLAAGTGQWGSGETSLLGALGFIVFDTLKTSEAGVAFGTAGGVAGLVASGAALYRTARSDDLSHERETCRTSTRSTGDCVNCVMSGEEGITMIVEGSAGAVGVAFAIAAAVSATGVGVPLGIAIAVAGGLAVAIDVGLNYNSIQQDCAGQRH